jgi:hypothetical protein
MLRFDKFYCFLLSYAPTGIRVVAYNEIHKWLSDNQAHLGGLAGIFPGMVAGTFIENYFRRRFEDKIPGHRERDDLFQGMSANILIYSDDVPGILQRQYLKVKTIRPPLFASWP